MSSRSKKRKNQNDDESVSESDTLSAHERKEQNQWKKITEGKIRLAQASKLPAIPYKLKGTKIIVFDTETTGVTEDDEIIQLSIIDGNGKTLINEYVHPYWKKDWAAAARVNGITPEMVKDAPYPHDLIPKVKGIFEATDLLIAYNKFIFLETMGNFRFWKRTI